MFAWRAAAGWAFGLTPLRPNRQDWLVKLLLVPVAIIAFIVFLLILGAIGLGVAMTVIAVVGKFFQLIGRGARLLSRGGRRLRSRRLRKRSPESA
jgi:hypothetical protein